MDTYYSSPSWCLSNHLNLSPHIATTLTSIIMWPSTTQLLDHPCHANCHTLDLMISPMSPIIFIFVEYPAFGILSHILISPFPLHTKLQGITGFYGIVVLLILTPATSPCTYHFIVLIVTLPLTLLSLFHIISYLFNYIVFS